MIIIGIDPGVNGGIAWMGECEGPTAHKMPATELDIYNLCNRADYGEYFAYIEWIHPAIQNIPLLLVSVEACSQARERRSQS